MGDPLAFRLNNQSERHVLHRTGKTVRELSEMAIGQISALLTRGKRFSFSTFSEHADQIGRGQMYPFAGRLISRRDIDRSL